LIAMQAAVLVPTLAWAWRTGYRPFRLLRLAPAPSATMLGFGVAAGLAAMVAGAGLHGLTRAALPQTLLELFDVRRALALERWNPGLLLLAVAIVPATCEELAFRGGLQSGLAGRRSPRRAIALSSLVFALYHLDPVRFPGVLLLGVVYGWLTWATGSIWPSMLAHALNNGLAVVGLLARPGADPAGDELVARPVDAALVLVIGLGFLGLVVSAARRWLPPAPEAASFLVPRFAPPGGASPTAATTAGAAPSPSGTAPP
jgi:membrane protease YdiL (CAAX protease family)